MARTHQEPSVGIDHVDVVRRRQCRGERTTEQVHVYLRENDARARTLRIRDERRHANHRCVRCREGAVAAAVGIVRRVRA